MALESPEAAFDVLYVIAGVEETYSSLSGIELQLFIYLACILGLYDGRPVSDWKYSFVAAPTSAPFSAELLNAIERLKRIRYVEEDEDFHRATDEGRIELERWMKLSRFSERAPYLHGAIGAAKTMPMAFFRNGIELEPQLRNAVFLRESKHLLDDAGLAQVYSQFKVLAEALGDSTPDFMVPAVVWLSFLLDEESREEAR